MLKPNPEYKAPFTTIESLEIAETARSLRPTRRSFLKWVGAAATYQAVTFLAYDQIHNSNILRPNPEIVTSDTDSHPALADSKLVVVPGFNCGYEDELLEATESIAGDYTQTARLHLGNEGIDIHDQADKLHEYFAHGGELPAALKNTYLYGHSTGGLLSLKLTARLWQKYGYTVSGISLDCSPVNQSSSKKAPAAIKLAGVMNAAELSGGRWTRTGIEFVNNFFIEGGTFASSKDTALQKAYAEDEPSNLVILSQMALILQSLTLEEISALHEARPKITYLRPDNPLSDRTVDVEAAEHTYRLLFDWMETRTITNGRHAAIKEQPERYTMPLKQSLRDAGFRSHYEY